MVEIDASYGEGGGQLVRMAVALSAATQTPIRLRNIRAKRANPGLAPQHLMSVRAIAELCDAQVEELALRSQTLRFAPRTLRGGHYRVDVGTAGSITLVLQALLPVMISASERLSATIVGGTDVRMAPPLDYFREVLLRLVARMGVNVELSLVRRGYYPRGGGEVRIATAPQRLRPLVIPGPGKLLQVSGVAHVSNLPSHIAERMRSSALARLPSLGAVTPKIDSQVLNRDQAIGSGGAIVLWADTESAVLGAGRVAERGAPAEMLGEAVGGELHADIRAGAALDVHATDQILIYLALARGESSFVARSVSLHAQTAMWVLEQFLPMKFTVESTGALTRVKALPV